MLLSKKPTFYTTLKVKGMSCPHCAAAVEKALSAIKGVTAKVDLEAATVTIGAPGSITREMMAAAIEAAGFGVEL